MGPKPYADRETVTELFNRGLSDAEMAATLGYTRVDSLVTRRIRLGLRRNTQPRRTHSFVTPDTLAQARALLEERAGYREVEQTTGISQGTLRRHFPGMGLTPIEAGHRSVLARKMDRIGDMI